MAARALRTGTARTVGLVVTDVTHPFFGPVLRGAQVAAWRAGYAVALVDVANDPDREMASFEALRAGPVDGFLFFTVDPPETSGEHVVALEVSPPGMAFVRFDTERGTELAIRHLLELGHTCIGHLGSELDAETFRSEARDPPVGARRGGARARAVRAGAVPVREARPAALELLDAGSPMTAVYCDDDLLAGGVYLAARERGVRIPDDLSVVGFDDLPFAQVFDPPLTTIRIDPEALGGESFEVLAALMGGDPQPPGRILPVELVLRGASTAAAGGDRPVGDRSCQPYWTSAVIRITLIRMTQRFLLIAGLLALIVFGGLQTASAAPERRVVVVVDASAGADPAVLAEARAAVEAAGAEARAARPPHPDRAALGDPLLRRPGLPPRGRRRPRSRHRRRARRRRVPAAPGSRPSSPARSRGRSRSDRLSGPGLRQD